MADLVLVSKPKLQIEEVQYRDPNNLLLTPPNASKEYSYTMLCGHEILRAGMQASAGQLQYGHGYEDYIKRSIAGELAVGLFRKLGVDHA